ncbi:MAG: plastocyanin/azurin family copper-binding protein [Acidobacteriota bacterium]
MDRASALSLMMLGTLLLAACGGGGSHSMSPTAARAPQVIMVEIDDNSFSPKSINVQPGDTVQWVLRGSSHNHTVTEANGLWNSGQVFTTAGATFQHTFSDADTGHTYLYYCTTHQACCQMQGSIRVGNSAPAPNPGY